MKKLLFIFPVLLILAGFTAQKIVDDKLKSLLLQFKTDEESAKSNILYAVSGPSYYFPNVKIIKDMAAGDRVAVIQSIGKNIKEYLSSKEFTGEYNKLREDRKPTPPEAPKLSNQLKDEQKANLVNAIAEAEKNKKQMPADQQPIFDELIKTFKQQLADLDDPNNTMYSSQTDEYIKQGHDMEMQDYNTKLAQWEADYPKDDPKPMIKKWISSFIDKTADINFNAKLEKDKYGKMKFADQQYESKDSQWKLFYRAGKETVDAARSFAQNWLKEIK